MALSLHLNADKNINISLQALDTKATFEKYWHFIGVSGNCTVRQLSEG